MDTRKSSCIAGEVCSIVAAVDRYKLEVAEHLGSLLLAQVAEHNNYNNDKLDYRLLWTTYQKGLDDYAWLIQNTTTGNIIPSDYLNGEKERVLMELDMMKSSPNLCLTILKCAYIVAKFDHEIQESERCFLREFAERYNLNLDTVALEFSALGY